MYSTFNYPGFEIPAFPQQYPYPFHEPETPPKKQDKDKNKKKPGKTGYNNPNTLLIC